MRKRRLNNKLKMVEKEEFQILLENGPHPLGSVYLSATGMVVEKRLPNLLFLFFFFFIIIIILFNQNSTGFIPMYQKAF